MGEVTTAPATQPRSAAPRVPVPTPAPAHVSLPRSLLSRPGDAAERRALEHVAAVSRGAAAGRRGLDAAGDVARGGRPGGQPGSLSGAHTVGHDGPHLPRGLPAVVADRAPAGRPLGPTLADRFGGRLGGDLSPVRLHDDDAAHGLAHAAQARAFTVGSHVFLGRGQFRPDTFEGSALLDHEFAHVLTAHEGDAAGPAQLLREPTAGAVTADAEPADPKAADPATRAAKEQAWGRLLVEAKTMDDAALVLGEFGAMDQRSYVYIGLSPSFVKVYDTLGKPLGPRVTFKEDVHVTFNPGVYLVTAGGLLRAVEFQGKDVHRQRLEEIDPKHPGSVLGTRELSAEEQKKAFDDAAAAGPGTGAAPDTTKVPVRQAQVRQTLNIDGALSDPTAFRALAAKVPGATVVYFVPSLPPHQSGKGKGGETPALYASPIPGRGDGLPANAPPWPVSVEGPKLVPRDSSPTFSAKVDWTANGNWSNTTAQVISQVGENIHYRWEYFDITAYAKAQLAKDAAGTKAVDPKAPPEKTLDQRIADFTTSQRGSGTDVTGSAAARREFSRDFEDWWKDTKRARKGAADPTGDTVAERRSNAVANELSLELAPVALLTTAIGAVAHLIADLFAGPRQQQEVNLPKDGTFLVRVISTPAVNEDREGKPIVRPPSVAGHVVEVAEMEVALNEALDEPAAQLAELRSQILVAESEHKPGTAAYLRDLLARAELRFGGVLPLLKHQRDAKVKELADFEAAYPHLSTYSLEHERDVLNKQIELYERYDTKRREGGAPLAQLVRVNAALYLESTGEQYPLLLSAGPMPMVDGRHHWVVTDVSTVEGADSYPGLGATPSEAFGKALAKFGGAAAYGRGRIGARSEGLGLEPGAPPTIWAESAPADWALAQKHIDDLVTTLAALGIIVASAGTAGAVIGASVAVARLLQRWRAGKLALDGATLSDLLGIVGGLGAAGHLVAELQVARLGKGFAILQKGAAAEEKLAEAAAVLTKAESLAAGIGKANEVIGYAGLIWGDVSFLDQMMSVNAQEASGAITHAAARRARADGISSAVQNNGLLIAGNVVKARQEAKAAARPEGKPPAAGTGGTTERPPGELSPTDHAPSDHAPSDQAPADRSLTELERARAAGYDVTATPQIGERRATAAELREALPPDLRDLAVVDPTLAGDHVTVDWTADPDTGLIAKITVRIGPEALPRTVALHTDTVRTMQKYQGLSGRLRQALSWVADAFNIPTLSPKDRARFNAELEVRKLPPIIAEHLAKLAAMPQTVAGELAALQSEKANARAEAEAHVDSLVTQLEEHLATLDGVRGTGGAEGEGVSVRGLSKANRARYAELQAQLRTYSKGSQRHRETRYEMYRLTGGTKSPEEWLPIYKGNLNRASKANEIVEAERIRLGWKESEVTIEMDEGDRRVDLYHEDGASRAAIEVKAYESGVVAGTDRNLTELKRDAKLVRPGGWSITWMFIDCVPTGPLRQALREAGITIELRTASERSSRLKERIPPLRRPR